MAELKVPYRLNLIIIKIIFPVYSSSLPVAHLSYAPRRRLVVTGDSAKIQEETTENSAWFFNVLSIYIIVTGGLGLKPHPKDN